MWSHYAAKNKGLCLQFDPPRDPRTFMQIVGIRYREEYPIISWTTNFNAGLKAVIETKHQGWCYEKETRILVLGAKHQYISFNPAALRGIIVGCRADDEVEGAFNELLAERSARKFEMPKLYQALKHESKYKLVIKKRPE